MEGEATAETKSLAESQATTSGENTPMGMKLDVPVKSALKTVDNSDDDDDYDSMDDDNNDGDRKPKAKKKKKKKMSLKWDEAKIEEHDKLRGTRMKIDEADTPFAQYYDSGSETDGSFSSARGVRLSDTAISWDALTNKLEAHAAAKEQLYPSSPSSRGGQSTDGDGDDNSQIETEEQRRERQRKELKRLEFQEHRKRHYNEMEAVRRFRREHPDGEPALNGKGAEEDSDDENDGDDEEE